MDDDASIEAAAKAVSERVTYLDVLVNNAGVAPAEGDCHPLKATRQQLQTTFNTNVSGVVITTQHFLPLLKAAHAVQRTPRVINLSSPVGSTTLLPSVLAHSPAEHVSSPYFVSKAALNNITVQFACVVPEVAFTALCPGWVKTDMGSEQAPITKQHAAQAITAFMETQKHKQSGQFIDIVTGSHLPF